MPYTPPTSRSPATTNPNSPVLSRNHSYDISSNAPLRPSLPRSRSATYLQKHRRTPSISDQQTSQHNGTLATNSQHHHINNGTKIATSHGTFAPVPLTAELLAESLTVSPSDSSLTSEDDEDRGRGRQIQELASSLKQSMVLTKRAVSPDRKDEDAQTTTATLAPVIRPALTPEARKISHSRSSSEIQLSVLADLPSHAASSESDDDEEDLLMKPPLLRKKSGELVKPALRPSSRRRRPSSMPGTPTYSKAVHFNEDIEQVRHFLQVDRPIAVSAGSSPVESFDSESEYPFTYEDRKKSNAIEWEIRASNFPQDFSDRQHWPVRVEKIFLSTDNTTLVGVVACANIAFQKTVVARFTLDYWKTTSEVIAEFNADVRNKEPNDGWDRFNFNIKLSDLAHLETKTMLLCVRFNSGGQEHWDNNNMMNYQIDFIKKVAPRKAKQGHGAGTLGSIPRSRHTPLPRPASFPSSTDDDFSAGFEFGAGTTILRDPQVPTRRNNRKGSLYPMQQKRGQHHGGGAFATRYDFGASLSAALTQAQSQNALGSDAKVRSGDYFSKPTHVKPAAAPAVQPVEGPNPAKMSSDRPELGSQEYHDLIQKFCYFGSKASSPGAMSPDPKDPAPTSDQQHQDDGHHSPLESDQSLPTSAQSSVSNSPPSPRPERTTQFDGAQDSHRPSRSSTPSFHTASPRLLAQYRSPSPALHEMPFQVLAQ